MGSCLFIFIDQTHRELEFFQVKSGWKQWNTVIFRPDETAP
jgi:hypothetical protein